MFRYKIYILGDKLHEIKAFKTITFATSKKINQLQFYI